MRTFIAIDLDPELKARIDDLVRVLKKTRADVRWISTSGMHLTLKFLGEIDQPQAVDVVRVLQAVASRHGRFPLSLQGTGAFPEGRKPRVLWVGIREAGELMALQLEIDKELEALGYSREVRPFHPHLTLGRVKGPGRLGSVLEELDRRRDIVFGEMTARTVTFFESVLKPEGAEYRPVAEFGLK